MIEIEDREINHLFELCKKTAEDSALLVKERFLQNNLIISDLDKDIKTSADYFIDDFIHECLSSTKIPILSEENPLENYSQQDMLWIVDPLDGTYNFNRGLEYACVSIALWINYKPRFGVIADIFNKNLFTGLINSGAMKNDQEIRVSKNTELKNSCLSTGFPIKTIFNEKNIAKKILRIKKFKKIRMLGSAALMTANVASGVFDAYEEENIFIWDIAAGLAIIESAGGYIQYNKTNIKYCYDVYANNGILNDPDI
jgi:myo-inositol-1(or 4)-monophosphatase